MSELPAFARATRVEKIAEGHFRLEVPSGWEQGRGAFGGLTLGVLVRAIEACEPERERVVRTVSGEIAGPVVPGAAEIRVTPLRRGKNQSNVRADFVQGGGVMATASVVLSAPRSAQAAPVERPLGAHASFESLSPLVLWEGSPAKFAQHFEYRLVEGIPFSGGVAPVARGWVRLAEPLAEMDAPGVIAHLDAWWSAILSVERAPRAFATITFLAELLVDPRELDPREPFFHDARVLASAGGFVVEERALYQRGRLVAMNHQTFAMLT